MKNILSEVFFFIYNRQKNKMTVVKNIKNIKKIKKKRKRRKIRKIRKIRKRRKRRKRRKKRIEDMIHHQMMNRLKKK